MDSPDKSGKTSRRHISYRSAHRARSHESAHADTEAPAGPAIENPLIPAVPATLVTDDVQLGELIEHLRSAGSFGYDSEFIGELTYSPKLCLIQVSSATQIALIDPLAALDLRPFWELVADPSVEKVCHAGQQDLEPVFRHLGRPPANVFDTQIAAGFIGLPYPVSLSKLVYELTGARLGKGLTFTHWDQRPLSSMQLRYAADDVRYLPLVRQRMRGRLDANGHARWAAEECAAQCDVKLFHFDPQQQYLRVRGAGALHPRNLAVLRELTVWRDAAARITDVPPRAFLKDEILIDLARNPVKSVEKLGKVRGLPRPVEAEWGPRIVQMTADALALPEARLPEQRDTEQTPPEKFRTDSLWAVAQCICSGQGVDTAVATNRQEINDFYQCLTRQNMQDTPHRLLTGWRREALGEALARLLRGDARVELTWPNGALNAITAHR